MTTDEAIDQLKKSKDGRAFLKAVKKTVEAWEGVIGEMQATDLILERLMNGPTPLRRAIEAAGIK